MKLSDWSGHIPEFGTIYPADWGEGGVDLVETYRNEHGNKNENENKHENGKGRQMVLCTVRVGTIISSMYEHYCLFTMHACALLKEFSAPRHQTRTQRYSVSLPGLEKQT